MTNKPIEIENSHVFEFSRGYRFQWEAAQQAFVLLYPEGMVSLNETAAEILKRMNGRASVSEITQELQNEFEADGLETDVKLFLGEAYARRWIQVAARTV